MCGVAGLIGVDPDKGEPAVRAMTDAIAHRGPDGAGLYRDGRIVLGHRRLSILELSPAGSQPLTSADGRWVVCYNGEIYNHLDLRKRLAAGGHTPAWRGHSDTETLAEALTAWGPRETLRRSHGMFAIAAWDRATRRMILARDRFGEKPLYFGKVGAALAFASELKAIHALGPLESGLDPVALRAMLGRGYVPPGRSIYRSIESLTPGTWATFDESGGELDRQCYYSLAAVALDGGRNVERDDVLDQLRDTLGAAVARQMVADVPVGTLLSGGIDSSLITALAVRSSSARIKTYSIGFAEAGFDEAPAARAVAEHLGTDHHERYLSASEALAMIPDLPRMYDEPFGDSSQIPTAIVCAFARQDVTVALTGDAGDEIFGGYRRHIDFPKVWNGASRLPSPVRRVAAGLGSTVPPEFWNRLVALRRRGTVAPFFGHKVRRTIRATGTAGSFPELTNLFLDEWAGLQSPVPECTGLDAIAFDVPELPLSAQLMVADALSYLPGDILTKVDRAAMAVSLEGRIPFLDPDVVALAARIPMDQKISGGTGKLILRRLLYEMVPRDLVDRPKAGFAIPVGEWLRGPLRDWAESHLSVAALERSGLLDPAPVRARWERHLAGREDASQALWSVLSFQAWYDHWHNPAHRSLAALRAA